MRSSAPLSVVKSIACPVGKTKLTVALACATTTPSVGSIAIPLPIAPNAKTWSGIRLSGTIFPISGLAMISC